MTLFFFNYYGVLKGTFAYYVDILHISQEMKIKKTMKIMGQWAHSKIIMTGKSVHKSGINRVENEKMVRDSWDQLNISLVGGV